jgi:hypothetical protein
MGGATRGVLHSWQTFQAANPDCFTLGLMANDSYSVMDLERAVEASGTKGIFTMRRFREESLPICSNLDGPTAASG